MKMVKIKPEIKHNRIKLESRKKRNFFVEYHSSSYMFIFGACFTLLSLLCFFCDVKFPERKKLCSFLFHNFCTFITPIGPLFCFVADERSFFIIIFLVLFFFLVDLVNLITGNLRSLFSRYLKCFLKSFYIF